MSHSSCTPLNQEVHPSSRSHDEFVGKVRHIFHKMLPFPSEAEPAPPTGWLSPTMKPHVARAPSSFIDIFPPSPYPSHSGRVHSLPFTPSPPPPSYTIYSPVSPAMVVPPAAILPLPPKPPEPHAGPLAEGLSSQWGSIGLGRFQEAVEKAHPEEYQLYVKGEAPHHNDRSSSGGPNGTVPPGDNAKRSSSDQGSGLWRHFVHVLPRPAVLPLHGGRLTPGTESRLLHYPVRHTLLPRTHSTCGCSSSECDDLGKFCGIDTFVATFCFPSVWSCWEVVYRSAQ